TPGPRRGWAASRSRAQRKAARVFPEPVGAETSTCLPDAIASHAPLWAAVGAANAEPNHAAAAAEKRASAGCTSDGTRTEEHAARPHASRFLGHLHGRGIPHDQRRARLIEIDGPGGGKTAGKRAVGRT